MVAVRAVRATESGRATEVAGQRVTVGANRSRLREGTQTTGSASRSEGSAGVGDGLRAAGGSLSAESGAQRQRDADLSSTGLIGVNLIDSTHFRILVFPLLLKSS